MARLPVSRGEYNSRRASKTLYNAMRFDAMQATVSLQRLQRGNEPQLDNSSRLSRVKKTRSGLMVEVSETKSCLVQLSLTLSS